MYVSRQQSKVQTQRLLKKNKVVCKKNLPIELMFQLPRLLPLRLLWRRPGRRVRHRCRFRLWPCTVIRRIGDIPLPILW